MITNSEGLHSIKKSDSFIVCPEIRYISPGNVVGLFLLECSLKPNKLE